MTPVLPFVPIRGALYTPDELYGSFKGADAEAFVRTPDFAIYKFWISSGAGRARDALAPMMEALHDNSITQAAQTFVAARAAVAIMGGHGLSRDDGTYQDIARIARELSRRERLVVSGGGPGAMEAAHLGALLMRSTETEFASALAMIARVPAFPASASNMFLPDGSVNMAAALDVANWMTPAFEVQALLGSRLGESLGIPTWQYGHEPSTPLATHQAKYFENSVREDGLVTVGNAGIIYAPGSAGTIQEVFQDACVNFYGTTRAFSPMVFLGKEYWLAKMPVVEVLRRLFGEPSFSKYVLATDEVAEAIEFVSA